MVSMIILSATGLGSRIHWKTSWWAHLWRGVLIGLQEVGRATSNPGGPFCWWHRERNSGAKAWLPAHRCSVPRHYHIPSPRSKPASPSSNMDGLETSISLGIPEAFSPRPGLLRSLSSWTELLPRVLNLRLLRSSSVSWSNNLLLIDIHSSYSFP